MTDQATAPRSDYDFHDELIKLIDGTHWAQKTLNSFCWILVNKQAAPEGAPVVERILAHTDEGESITSEPPWYADSWEKVWVWEKAQWCIVGMVLQVGRLSMDEEVLSEVKMSALYGVHHNDRIAQPRRIIEQLWEELPDDRKSNMEYLAEDYKSDEVPDAILRVKISNIETYNDHADTTKEAIRELVVRARDKQREVTNGSE